MKKSSVDIHETIRRLRKHPIWTNDKQNITADAAWMIGHMEIALKRLAYPEAFTSSRMATEEETARMKYAQSVLDDMETRA